jgi:hypothetical protein
MKTHAVIDELGTPYDLGTAQIFNPAILPLPADSKWQFVGALRIHRMVMVHEVSEHDWKIFGCATSLAISIVWLTSYRIGLNISDDGQFFAVTNGVTLILPNPSPWAKGIDDPKLFYSVS